ncbi:MAG: hypothetical protein KIG75_00210 [Bacteroidales bacterium]|nr:hypothetical protein [Bacteroidales bacterium]
MKKIIPMLASAIALSLTALPSEAQSHLVKLTNHLEPYGFFRASAIFDARDSKADTEDLFYYVPYDKKINLEGNDIWYNPSIKMSAITTRLGVNLTGFRYGSFNVTGKLETDFYLLTGGSASLSLREAYLKFNWDNLGDFFKSVSVKAGHAWHPMSLDMPYSVGYEAGAPFNPYARSPQLMFETNLMDRFTFTAGLLYPMEFMPTGPQGPSADYVKYGLVPELYAGLTYSSKYIKARVGADFISLVPRWRTTDLTYYHDVGTKVKDRISMISPMACFEFSKGMFKVNAKAVLASGGDHLRLMGGYAVYDKSDDYKYKYTPLRSVTGFVSASYGQQWQFILFTGGMTALGAGHDLITDDETGYAKTAYIYYFDGGFKNIHYMFRVAPAVAFNLERLTCAIEYNSTGVIYGQMNELNARGLANMGEHLIINHRILGVVRYSF